MRMQVMKLSYMYSNKKIPESDSCALTLVGVICVLSPAACRPTRLCVPNSLLHCYFILNVTAIIIRSLPPHRCKE